jgi:phage-related protein
MNEIEYILRIVLKARDELATALKRAREELRLFANAAETNQNKINAFNESMEKLSKNADNITDKFREWRAILQGTADDSAKTKKSVDALAKEVEETAKATRKQADAQEKAAKAQDALLKSADKLRNEYKELSKQEAQTDRDREHMVFRLKEIGAELEGIRKKVNDPDIKRFYFNWARDAREASDAIQKAHEEVTRNQAEELKKQIDAENAALKFAEKMEKDHFARRARERDQLVKTYNNLIARGLQDQIAAEERAARESVKIEEEAATRRTAIRKRESDAYKASVAQRAHLDRLTSGKATYIDIGRAEETVKELRRVARAYDDTHKQQRRLLDDAIRLEHALRNVGKEGDKTSSVFSKLRGVIGGNSDSVATLDNKLRGLGLLLVVGFAQQLINVLGGLAGAFVSVGLSAGAAGTAIGGMFVAGIAQALPAIGLLSAALVRVKSVMDAVKQAQAAQEQGAVQQATAHRRVADAADTLREAQERLTQARKDAREEIKELIDAERDAQLAAAGAALSQEEAQERLREAIATGGDVARAQLDVLQANADAEDAIEEKRDARRKSRQAQRGGVEAMPGVVQAQQQLETAKRNAQEAAEGTETAVAKLNYLLSQLSPAERRLYEAVTNFQNLFRSGVYREITDNLVNSFARSVEKITKIIQMPEVVGLARRTSKTLADTMNSVFDRLTTKPMIDQLVRIGEAGRKNLKPLGDIAVDVGKSLANIAEAAGPSFRRFLRFVRDLVGQFEDLTGRKRTMVDFFETGEKHLEAWVKLGVAIIRFFLALAGAGGARSGLTTIKDATKAVDDLTKKIQDNGKGVGKFFENSREILYEVVGVVAALAEELSEAWTPERVHDFATLLKDVVIPALGDVIDFLGDITQKIIEWADTPIGGQIIRFGVAVLLVSKIVASTFGAFIEFARTIGFLLEPIVGMIEWIGEGGLVTMFERLKDVAKFLRGGGGVVKGVGIVGLVLALLGYLGLLDDAWREVKSAFVAFWDEVQPSLEDFFKQIKDLWDAVAEGKGVFGLLKTVLTPIFKLLIDIGGVFLRVFGRWLGRIIGGAIDVLSGLIQFITGVFTGDWDKAWEGIKKVFRGIWRVITAPIRALPELISGIAKKILPALRDGVEALWEWLKKLPGRLGNLASDAADAFVDAFSDVGSRILDALMEGLKGAGNIAKDLANAFIDLLNWIIPDKIPTFGPDIPLPDDPIPHLASGGVIGGRYSQGDRYTVRVAGEEVILNPLQQGLIGRDRIMSTLRATGAQFLRPGDSYQGGAQPAAGAGALTVSFEGGNMDAFLAIWRVFWNNVVLLAMQGSNRVAEQFRDMRAIAVRNANRMYREIRDALIALDKSFEFRGNRIVDSWSRMWMSLMQVTHKGLVYIGHETNQGLKGLGEKHIDFGYAEPKKPDGKAGGGWIGMQGQRGRDRGLYPLGAGEAVLNWQHQKYVEPAMNAYYGHGLSDMFKRTHGYHAGGPEQTGFAAGGFSPIPGFPGEEAATRIIPLLVKLMKQYHFIPTDVYDRDHSAGHKSPGHNVTGTALDAVPNFGAGGSWELIEAMGRWAVAQGMTVGYGAGVPGSQPWAGHGRGNHIHIELGGNPSVAGAFLASITEIGRPLIKGEGKLAEMAQAAIDMVLKAANAMLTETFDPVSGATTFRLGPGGPAQKVFDFFTGRGLSDAIAAGFVGTFQKESGFNTTILNAAGSGAQGLAQWLGGRLTALQSHPNWQSLQTQLNFVWEELMGSESAAFAAIKNARTPEEAAYLIDSRYERSDNILSAPTYARQAYDRFHHTGPRKQYAEGGEIPGPLGQAVDITAHAREWIVNPLQQARLAALTGLSRSGLKSMLGFYGGKGSYQGGGDPTADITPLTRADVRGIDDRRLRRLVVALRRLGTQLDKMAEATRPAERFFTGLDKTMDTLGRLSTRLNRVSEKADRRTGVRGFLEAVEGMTGDNGLFAKLREAIERRTAVFARRLQRQQFTVSGRRGARVVTRVQDDVQVAQAELAEQQRQRGELVDERNAQARALAQVRRQQRRKGLTDKQRERLQAQENTLQAALEESRQRVVDNTQAIFDAQQNVADAVEAQQEAIKQALEDLVQGLRDAADKINATAQRRLGALDLAGRMLDALGVVGLRGVSGGVSRASIFAGRGAALAAQQTQLQGVLGRARATKGAEELVAELEDQIAELSVAIKENSRALFDARVEDVNSRAGFALNINDLNKQLIELDGQIAGNTDQAALLLKAQERGEILLKQGNELSALLAETTPGTQQWQDLSIAVLENTIAQKQNTIATNELTGATAEPQTFTSSAWSRFREAIFTGMGQVLPQYNPQNMMGEVNTGAVIIPAGSTTNNTTGSRDVNITLNEAGGPVDLEAIGGAVVFASKTSQ